MTSIGRYAFSGCISLTSITIPDNVINIAGGAFSGCTNLARITIPDSVISIGSSAFAECTSLASITIPDGVTDIGGSAFYDTAYYSNSDNWSDGVLYIGNHLIDAKEDIVKGDYVIRQGTKCIADIAFYFCTGLTSVTIPNSVTSIDYDAFDGCDNLVMTVFEGSFAHKYAVENNIKFKLIETVTGDPNGDGVIGLDDAILAARTDVGNTQISDGQIMSADVNGDGKVTVHDALLIVRFSLGLIDKFPTV